MSEQSSSGESADPASLYKEVSPKVHFPAVEEEVIRFWKDHDIFRESIRRRENRKEFIFYDGPPFATGLPHFGHFVPGTLKDIIPRYKTMKGFKVERRFGWDCHGLPVEYEVEKELKISGKTEIETYGVSRFNEKCRSIVSRYTKEWREVVTRMGRWVDFENEYRTMDLDYMESIWWVFRQLWEKNLVYRGYYILPYCPRCSTVLSNHELNLGGYKDVYDPAITVSFPLAEEPETSFLVWTTTPWTLPSNLGLALGADIDYVKVRDGERCFILAEALLEKYYRSPEEYQIVERKKGKELRGISYRPLFSYFEDEREKGAFQTFLADFVSVEDGTGIVHLSPGFGEDDYRVLRDVGVSVLVPVDEECRFTDEVPDYQGRFVKDCDKDIIKFLKEKGRLIRREQYLHAYPHCWRCDAPLIYRAVSSWFIRVESMRDRLLRSNEAVDWVPDHLKKGRFGKWLEGARDWAISRNRYWGNPIPIWICDTCGEEECIGSREELEKKSGRPVEDLHKHFTDEIRWPCSCGGSKKRVAEVLDCWFESGAMPYAQKHYPFENEDRFRENFPADFIAEGLDQTRGWFYTLMILATALFEKPAFKNVVVNGLVLAEDGKKMSKSARNYTDPMEIINRFGADALRLFLMNSLVVRGENIRYSDEGVKETLKTFMIPFWNAYSFFVTYARVDGVRISGKSEDFSANHSMDIWILSEAEKLTEVVTENMDRYNVQKAIKALEVFIEQLNNWYIRRSRRRFWKSENDRDKQEAYRTLYHVLFRLNTLAAPFIPMTTEAVFRNLRTAEDPESVHLLSFPVPSSEKRNLLLERKMDFTQKAVFLGRSLRNLHSLKNRQPLKTLYVVSPEKRDRDILFEMEEILKEELNVKNIVLQENEEELVEYSCKADFRVLGKTLGKDMKPAAGVIEKLETREILSLLQGGVLSLDYEGNEGRKTIEISRNEVVIQRTEKSGLKVMNEGSLTVALDPEITEELFLEGLTRDLVRGVQNLRKESRFRVTDRISLRLSGSSDLKKALSIFEDYLKKETLTDTVIWLEEEESPVPETEITVGEQTCRITLIKK